MLNELKNNYNNLITQIKFKMTLQDKLINIDKQIKDKIKLCDDKLKIYNELELKEKNIEGYNQYLIGMIKHLENPNKSLRINLIGQEIKQSKIEKLKNFLGLFKFDGYFVYFNKAEEMSLIKVKNIKFFNKVHENEMYNIHEKMGTYNNKPVFLIKYPYAISLNINDNGDLYYDTEAYYNYLTMATKGNLTNFGSTSTLSEFIKKYWIVIVILVILGLLFFTPQGKEILLKLFPSKTIQ